MKESFRQSMSWAHTWLGLVFGWLLFGILLTGSLAVFYSEIVVWATPELPVRQQIDRTRALDLAVTYLQSEAPDARVWRIVLPSDREPFVRLVIDGANGKRRTHRLDPVTGRALTHDVRGGFFYLRYHYQLLMPRDQNITGLFLVGAAGIVMMIACISGIIIHKRIFRDFFTFRPAANRQRAWLDAHNVLSVLPLPFHVMMAYTGLMILYWDYMPAAVDALYGGNTATFRTEALSTEYQSLAEPPGGAAPLHPILSLIERAERYLGERKAATIYVRYPNRDNAVTEVARTRTDIVSQQVPKVAFDGLTGAELRVLDKLRPAVQAQATGAALHFIEWGGPLTRWVYFLAGLAGTITVAAGLNVFILKREQKGGAPSTFNRLVHTLNITSVAGISIACVSFMWAERLVPYAPGEQGGGAHDTLVTQIFFGVWFATFLHALVVAPARAWWQQWAVAAALCIALPLTGLWVDRTLWQTLAEGDWLRSGVDLTAIGAGVVLAFIARWAWRRQALTPREAVEPALGRTAERAVPSEAQTQSL